MLKEEKIEDEPLFCLHPTCPQPHQRCFNPVQPHSHNHCQRWVASLHDLIAGQSDRFTAKQMKDIEVDFEENPVSSLRLLDKLHRSPWENVVEQEERYTKAELNKAIEIEFEGLRERMKALLAAASLLRQVRPYTDRPYAFSEQVNQYYLQQGDAISSLGKEELFRKSNSRDRIRKVKQSVAAVFDGERQPRPPNALLTTQEHANFRDFVFEDSGDYFNRLQVLTSALAIPTPHYSLEAERLCLSCPLCPVRDTLIVTPETKRGVKKELAEGILVHLYSEHQE